METLNPSSLPSLPLPSPLPSLPSNTELIDNVKKENESRRQDKIEMENISPSLTVNTSIPLINNKHDEFYLVPPPAYLNQYSTAIPFEQIIKGQEEMLLKHQKKRRIIMGIICIIIVTFLLIMIL